MPVPVETSISRVHPLVHGTVTVPVWPGPNAPASDPTVVVPPIWQPVPPVFVTIKLQLVSSFWAVDELASAMLPFSVMCEVNVPEVVACRFAVTLMDLPLATAFAGIAHENSGLRTSLATTDAGRLWHRTL